MKPTVRLLAGWPLDSGEGDDDYRAAKRAVAPFVRALREGQGRWCSTARSRRVYRLDRPMPDVRVAIVGFYDNGPAARDLACPEGNWQQVEVWLWRDAA